MAHHIRVRHKGKAFIIDEIGTDQLKLSNTNDDPMDVLESGESAKTGIQTETENVNSSAGMLAKRRNYPCIITHVLFCDLNELTDVNH